MSTTTTTKRPRARVVAFDTHTANGHASIKLRFESDRVSLSVTTVEGNTTVTRTMDLSPDEFASRIAEAFSD